MKTLCLRALSTIILVIAGQNVSALEVALGRGGVAVVEVRDSIFDAFEPPNESIMALFDGNRSTAWSPGGKGCHVGLMFRTDRPVYFKAVRIENKGRGVTLNSVVAIHEHLERETPLADYGRRLGPATVQILKVDSRSYFGVFGARRIAVDMDGCDDEQSRVQLTEYGLEVSDDMFFEPRWSAAQVKERVRRVGVKYSGGSRWHLEDDRGDQERDGYLAHLAYYGLKGDGEAEGLLLAYTPPSADTGEETSLIKQYYRAEKKRLEGARK